MNRIELFLGENLLSEGRVAFNHARPIAGLCEPIKHRVNIGMTSPITVGKHSTMNAKRKSLEPHRPGTHFQWDTALRQI